ncbi:MAG: hypothetical protein R2847_11900 [Bacteroidia bacterium]
MPQTITETGHPHQFVMNITMAAALAGLIGAKIFHNLENIDDFMRDPVDALFIQRTYIFGGLSAERLQCCGIAAKN